jgi:hypothetical protein
MGTAGGHSDDRYMPLTEPLTDVGLWDHPFIVTAVERRHAGLVLKAWREAHWPDRIPQDALARLLGLTQGTVSRTETRSRPPCGPAEWDRWFDAIGAPTHLRWWRAGGDD